MTNFQDTSTCKSYAYVSIYIYSMCVNRYVIDIDVSVCLSVRPSGCACLHVCTSTYKNSVFHHRFIMSQCVIHVPTCLQYTLEVQRLLKQWSFYERPNGTTQVFIYIYIILTQASPYGTTKGATMDQMPLAALRCEQRWLLANRCYHDLGPAFRRITSDLIIRCHNRF